MQTSCTSEMLPVLVYTLAGAADSGVRRVACNFLNQLPNDPISLMSFSSQYPIHTPVKSIGEQNQHL
jgi:hypothetical protein